MVALDTNVIIYLHDLNNPFKRKIAQRLVVSNPIISSQVISE
jgi:predicted nucleic acid-binding protein